MIMTGAVHTAVNYPHHQRYEFFSAVVRQQIKRLNVVVKNWEKSHHYILANELQPRNYEEGQVSKNNKQSIKSPIRISRDSKSRAAVVD